MKYIKKIDEFFFFETDELKKHYSSLAKEFGLAYNKIGERSIKLGPKNGHEINVLIGADSCFVRPSYYGTSYEKEENVKDLREYLQNYDFSHKPNIINKFNHNE